jgi:hypothetical protein
MDLFKQEGEGRPPTAHWRPTAETLRRLIIVVGRNAPIRNMDDALGVLKGFRVRICVEAEKELQIFGCGWRIVTCQFRGKNVLLHHNSNTARMKRNAFKARACVGSVEFCGWWSPTQGPVSPARLRHDPTLRQAPDRELSRSSPYVLWIN